MIKRWRIGPLLCTRFPMLLLVVMVGLGLLADADLASAQDDNQSTGSGPASDSDPAAQPDPPPDRFTVDFGSNVRGEPGSQRMVADVEVPAHLQGRSCRATAVAHNGSSVHVGNDLIVVSGEGRTVMTGVEDASDADMGAVGDLIVGRRLEAWLRFGPDGRASLDFDLDLRCPLVPVVVEPVPIPKQTDDRPPEPEPTPESPDETPVAEPVAGEPTFTG